jgi:hypothetical protein
MRLGTIATLQEALGCGSKTYCCALKKAAGLHGTRLFDIDAALTWRKRNPQFKMTDVYPNKPRRKK